MATSSSKNVLLVKSDIGKTKISTYNLPSENYTYGKPYIKDKEGAKEVSMTWNFHQSTREPIVNVDFKKMNKEKIKASEPKSKEYLEKEGKQQNQLSSKKNILPDEQFTYGKKVKPSTPIGKLLANNFGEESEQTLNEIYAKQTEEKKAKKKLEVKQNKSQLLNSNKNQRKIEEKAKENERPKAFTLKKFQKVEARIDTNKVKANKPQSQNKIDEELNMVEKYFEQKD